MIDLYGKFLQRANIYKQEAKGKMRNGLIVIKGTSSATWRKAMRAFCGMQFHRNDFLEKNVAFWCILLHNIFRSK